jgi:hypothetical protein
MGAATLVKCSTTLKAALMMMCKPAIQALRGTMDASIEFKSHVPVQQRFALEALLYFNTCQGRVADSIANAVERFGAPEIVADFDRLRIHIPGMKDVQSLFAIEKATGRPVGVAVYTRQDVEHVTVMHIGIAAEYASGGPKANAQLLLRLMREVRRSSRRLKGVRSVELFYASRRLGSRWRESTKAAL